MTDRWQTLFRMKSISRLGIGLFMAFYLALMGGISSYAQETAPAENPATVAQDRGIPRFQEEVEWINWASRYSEGFPIDLMFVGDSITHFWEDAGKDVWDQYFGNRMSFNFGISGDKTGHVIWRLENAPMKNIVPKMIVVMIGTNNRTTPEQTAGGIEKIVSMLKDRYPNAKILLLDIFPRGEKPDDPRRLENEKVNALMAGRYDNDDQVIQMNINSVFLEDDGTLSPEIMPDYLHPSKLGYEKWAAAIEPEIEKVLGPIPAEVPEATGVARELERFEEKNNLFKNENFDVLMIGDSITHYWEWESGAIWDQLFAGQKAINLGTGWDRTENVVWRLEHYDFGTNQPSKAFLLIGVNNSGGSRPDHIGKGVKKIVTILHEKFPQMKIYVQEVFPWGDADVAGHNEKREKINAAICSEVESFNFVTLLDLSPVFLTEERKIDEPLFMGDHVHLTKAGYQAWADFIDSYVHKD